MSVSEGISWFLTGLFLGIILGFAAATVLSAYAQSQALKRRKAAPKDVARAYAEYWREVDRKRKETE